MKFLALIAAASALRLGTCTRDAATCCKDGAAAAKTDANACCFTAPAFACGSLSGGDDATCCASKVACVAPAPEGCAGHTCGKATC